MTMISITLVGFLMLLDTSIVSTVSSSDLLITHQSFLLSFSHCHLSPSGY